MARSVSARMAVLNTLEFARAPVAMVPMEARVFSGTSRTSSPLSIAIVSSPCSSTDSSSAHCIKLARLPS
ncbi:hypothetical protein DQ04_07301000 [Trypanosoma grayi]|uniref:hypothetical protein n=1 Tax=Trypanosoma grayi TaxID=71804 RepID=UPI0004F42662|nr:hypothetical protein DQ04_07301000 [Trypanosoma grayi]KEG08387.1 hypothetical protein DQ04_07301000 [Trypanosoma grayi]